MKKVNLLLILLIASIRFYGKDCYFIQKDQKILCKHIEAEVVARKPGMSNPELCMSMRYIDASGSLKKIDNLKDAGVTKIQIEDRTIVYLENIPVMEGFGAVETHYFFVFEEGPYTLYRQVNADQGHGVGSPYKEIGDSRDMQFPMMNGVYHVKYMWVLKAPDGKTIFPESGKKVKTIMKPLLEKIPGFAEAFKGCNYDEYYVPAMIQLANSLLSKEHGLKQYVIKMTGDTIRCHGLYFERDKHSLSNLTYWDKDYNKVELKGFKTVSAEIKSFRHSGFIIDALPKPNKLSQGNAFIYRCVDGPVKEYLLYYVSYTDNGRIEGFQNYIVIKDQAPIRLESPRSPFKDYQSKIFPLLKGCGFKTPDQTLTNEFFVPSVLVSTLYNAACK